MRPTQKGFDLSRMRTAPSVRLGHTMRKSQCAFAQPSMNGMFITYQLGQDHGSADRQAPTVPQQRAPSAQSKIGLFRSATTSLRLQNFWGVAVVGFLIDRALWWERGLAFAAGVSLLLAIPLTDEIGFVLAALFLGLRWWRTRTQTSAPAA